MYLGSGLIYIDVVGGIICGIVIGAFNSVEIHFQRDVMVKIFERCEIMYPLYYFIILGFTIIGVLCMMLVRSTFYCKYAWG